MATSTFQLYGLIERQANAFEYDRGKVKYDVDGTTPKFILAEKKLDEECEAQAYFLYSKNEANGCWFPNADAYPIPCEEAIASIIGIWNFNKKRIMISKAVQAKAEMKAKIALSQAIVLNVCGNPVIALTKPFPQNFDVIVLYRDPITKSDVQRTIELDDVIATDVHNELHQSKPLEEQKQHFRDATTAYLRKRFPHRFATPTDKMSWSSDSLRGVNPEGGGSSSCDLVQHAITPGESIAEIAQRYGVTPDAIRATLLAANPSQSLPVSNDAALASDMPSVVVTVPVTLGTSVDPDGTTHHTYMQVPSWIIQRSDVDPDGESLAVLLRMIRTPYTALDRMPSPLVSLPQSCSTIPFPARRCPSQGYGGKDLSYLSPPSRGGASLNSTWSSLPPASSWLGGRRDIVNNESHKARVGLTLQQATLFRRNRPLTRDLSEATRVRAWRLPLQGQAPKLVTDGIGQNGANRNVAHNIVRITVRERKERLKQQEEKAFLERKLEWGLKEAKSKDARAAFALRLQNDQAKAKRKKDKEKKRKMKKAQEEDDPSLNPQSEDAQQSGGTDQGKDTQEGEEEPKPKTHFDRKMSRRKSHFVPKLDAVEKGDEDELPADKREVKLDEKQEGTEKKKKGKKKKKSEE